MEKIEMKYQQGDVILRLIQIDRANLKPHHNNHLAEGEVTGHYHAAIGDGVAVLEDPKGKLYMDAPNGGEVVHQEHGVVEVPPAPPGWMYEHEGVKEYDHFLEETREVRD